jgi:small-conductance mechanosensitive channel
LSALSRLAGNALVVLGLAVALSVLSYAHWEAREQRICLRVALRAWPCQVSWDAGVLLVSTGLLVSSRSLLERTVWGAFVLVYMVVGMRRLLHRRDKAGSLITKVDGWRYQGNRDGENL